MHQTLLPLDTGPAWMRAVTHVNPLAHMVTAERLLFAGTVTDRAVLWARSPPTSRPLDQTPRNGRRDDFDLESQGMGQVDVRLVRPSPGAG